MANNDRTLDEKLPYTPSPTETAFSGHVAIPMPEDPDSPPAASQKKSWLARRAETMFAGKETFNLNDTIVQDLDSCPEGYPQLAAFQASDDSFSQYRGFGYLHSRILLALQAEITVLEGDLKAIDEYDWQEDGRQDYLKSRAKDLADVEEGGYEGSRPELLNKLRNKLIEYDDMLIRARDLGAFQRPSKRDYHSLRSWYYSNAPLLDSEADCIKHKEDIVTLRQGREWAGFDGLIETSLRKIDCKLVRFLFCNSELRRKTIDENAHYYSAARIETFVALLITCVIFILLVLPVVAMYELTCNSSRDATFDAVGVLIVFTLLFSAAMSLLTKARRHELFAASSAYCAVLVVFISNFNNVGQVSASHR
ncbi:hypothetical protein W97_01533 [Coniosporium apollinis CBS 100218]|uniref:DUF6594 domain-containing protein n=1 Tax=Coniosporium apollinis (strain CBS 100218) TaxID=1168221 RepID=R7YK58_CONA1|nr:uncharacterized protein W97_01533 [Coniosporium apollinis CBS 100218]EON62312.1 hypothetical protein W97_01533 [Coniosporium apollinis CBS 100218]